MMSLTVADSGESLFFSYSRFPIDWRETRQCFLLVQQEKEKTKMKEETMSILTNDNGYVPGG